MNDGKLHGIDDYRHGGAVHVGRLKEELKKAHQENKSLRERVADSEDYNATLNRSLGTQKDALDCGLRKIEKMRGIIDNKNEQIVELNKEADDNLMDHRRIADLKDQIARLTADNEDLKVEVEDTTDQYCSDVNTAIAEGHALRREVEALTVLLKLKL